MSVPKYPTPLDPRVAMLVATFDEVQREAFEERAAIIEYESSGIERREAEVEALLEILTSRPGAPVRVFRLESADDTQWVLTTDPDPTRVRDLGAGHITEENLRAVINTQYGGLAYLSTSP